MPGIASAGNSAAATQPLAMSMRMTQIAKRQPLRAQRVGAAGIAAAQLADVDAAAQAADDEAADNGAEKIGEQDLENEFHGEREVFQGRKISASIQRTLPPPWRSIMSIGTREHRVHRGIEPRVLARGERVRGGVRHHEDGEVAQVLVPAAHLEHVAGECAHFGVVDGDSTSRPGAQPRRHARAVGRRRCCRRATTAMRVPTLMTTLVW